MLNETLLKIPSSSVTGQCSPVSNCPFLIEYSENAPEYLWYGFSGPKVAFCMYFHGKNCRCMVPEEGYWKDFLN
jgi:hypothetical protein